MLLPALLLAPALLLPPASVGAAAVALAPAQVPAASTSCTPTDSRLTELSGLGVRAGTLLATGDGDVTQVLELDPVGCAVTGALDVGLDLRDVEDLAVAADGTVWLADTGDNRSTRDTVALVSVGEGGAASVLHRLSYPDGPHDAEALLLQRDGRPVVVTKAISGTAGMYAPALAVGQLPTPGPTPLTRVGQVRVVATDTPGGPLGALGSVLVTGGAVSADGTVVALRTYTDAYVWSAPDGDVVSALAGGAPVRVPLADEPQGEAVAFAADGALLSGSESLSGVLPAVRTVAGVARLALAPAQTPETTTPTTTGTPTTEQPAPGSTGSGLERWQAAVISVVVAAAVVWLVGRIRKLGRRR